MWKDPIAQEVRKAGEGLAERANYNLRDLFQRLRGQEKGTGTFYGVRKGYNGQPHV